MDARQAFLSEHARLHAAATSDGADISFEDGLCDGLSDGQLRARPLGLNSIAWLLWHLTRFEDVTVSTVLRGAPEVLDREGWLDRLGISDRLAGTGSSDDEVEMLSARIDPAALRAYRAAVGRETRVWVAGLDAAALDETPDVAGRLARAPTALDGRAAWVPALWEGRTVHGLLLLPVIAHGYLHIGEARVTRGRLDAASR